MRTSFLVLAVVAAAVAFPQAAGASVVGDLLGLVSGSGSAPPPSQPSPPPSQRPGPQSGGTAPDVRPVRPSNPLLAPEQKCPGQTDESLGPAAQERVMACMLSYARVARHRPALHRYKPFRFSATEKARDIRRCQRLSHTACGRDVWYWISRVGFFQGDWVAGEILADGTGAGGTALGTMRRWLASDEHRAVIFHSKFNKVGVGTVVARFHGVRHVRIWVAHFGYRHF